jgi:hypothetical protein
MVADIEPSPETSRSRKHSSDPGTRVESTKDLKFQYRRLGETMIADVKPYTRTHTYTYTRTHVHPHVRICTHMFTSASMLGDPRLTFLGMDLGEELGREFRYDLYYSLTKQVWVHAITCTHSCTRMYTYTHIHHHHTCAHTYTYPHTHAPSTALSHIHTLSPTHTPPRPAATSSSSSTTPSAPTTC